MKPLAVFEPAAMIAFALNILLPLTAVCLIALIAARCVFRHHPSMRYSVCLAGLFCILLCPLAVCIRDEVGYGWVTVSLPVNFFTSSSPVIHASSTFLAGTGRNIGLHETFPMQKWIAWGGWAALFTWITGVAWGIVRFAQGWKEVSRLTAGIRPWKASAHVETPARLERILGCPMPPVFLSPCVMSPVAVGLFHPAVILPEGLTEALTPVQLRQVLLHECAHIAFRHPFGGVVSRIAGLVFWPHPLVRALCRETAQAREEVCDNVASQEDGAACYARTLLDFAQGRFAAPNVASMPALLGPETSLEDRIAGLLDPRRNRMVPMKQGKLWAVTGAAIFAVGLTIAVRVVSAEAKTKQDAAGASAGTDQREAKQKAEAASQVERAEKLEAEAKQAKASAARNVEVRPVGANRFEVRHDGRKIGLLRTQPNSYIHEKEQLDAEMSSIIANLPPEEREDKLKAEAAAKAELAAKREAEAKAKGK